MNIKKSPHRKVTISTKLAAFIAAFFLLTLGILPVITGNCNAVLNNEGNSSQSIQDMKTSTASNESLPLKNAPSVENEFAGAGVVQSEARDALIIGITIGVMEVAFKTEGKTVVIRPEAQKALTQIKKDGFVYIHMMDPFSKGYMQKFPDMSVQAVKLLTDQGFRVLITINDSPFINGDTESNTKWTYRYFPGNDPKGTDDDGGLPEHKKRMTKFMDALLAEGLIPKLQFQLFDEPNSKRAFWGTFDEFEKLLAANIEVITQPKYGIADKDIIGPAFTSKLAINGDNPLPEHKPYWNFVKGYKQNPLVNKFPFAFNYYPVIGNVDAKENYKSSDLKLPPVYDGAWITGMNVAASMTEANLEGKGAKKGFRQMNTFKEKAEDIIQFAKAHHMAGIYFFNLKNRSDEPKGGKGKIATGLFNAEGCPRKEYKDLLEILHRPINFDRNCPDPDKPEYRSVKSNE
jgi:hypothetical protein